MIDLHSHILPGVDDGPPDLEGSLALARAAVEGGTTVIAATPHINFHFGVEVGEIAAAVAELNAAFAREGLPLEVIKGGEIAIPRLQSLERDDLATLHLGSGPWLLVEAPLSPVSAPLEDHLLDLRRRGHEVLLAHPERSLYFHQHPERLRQLVDAGVRSSITAGALAGRFGETVRHFTLKLFADGLVHNVASDAHDHVRRSPEILEAFEMGDAELPGLLEQADWYTRVAPAAMIAGEPVPDRPEPPRQHRRRRLFSRGAG